MPEASPAFPADVAARYKQFVQSGSPPVVMQPFKIVVGILLCLGVFTIPVGLWLIYQGAKGKPDPAVEAELTFADRAVSAIAAPVMVNTALREPSTHNEVYPGLFVISFDPRAYESLGQLAELILFLDPSEPNVSENDRDYLESILADMDFKPNRRRAIPLHLTRGIQCYFVDLAVPTWYLAGRHISDEMPLVPCLADAGDVGRVRVMPYWIAVSQAPPPIGFGMTRPYLGP